MTLANPLTHALEAACAGAETLDIAEVALLLSALDRRGVELGPYRAHLADIARAIRDRRDASEAALRRDILSDVLHGEFGYFGDGDLFEAPENANLIDVMDRRVGLPVAPGILYLHAARAAAWSAHGISFPGNFLVQVEGDDGVALLDPFAGGKAMEHADLYGILRRLVGPAAKLEENHLEPVSDRAVLIRLLSNLKARALRSGDNMRALELLDRMSIVTPREAGFAFEQGQLFIREGQPMAAKAKFEAALACDAKGPWAARVTQALEDVKRTLN